MQGFRPFYHLDRRVRTHLSAVFTASYRYHETTVSCCFTVIQSKTLSSLLHDTGWGKLLQGKGALHHHAVNLPSFISTLAPGSHHKHKNPTDAWASEPEWWINVNHRLHFTSYLRLKGLHICIYNKCLWCPKWHFMWSFSATQESLTQSYFRWRRTWSSTSSSSRKRGLFGLYTLPVIKVTSSVLQQCWAVKLLLSSDRVWPRQVLKSHESHMRVVRVKYCATNNVRVEMLWQCWKYVTTDVTVHSLCSAMVLPTRHRRLSHLTAIWL